MADKKEMFESGVIKLDFLAKSDDDFNEAMSEINKRVDAEKKAGKVAEVVANQKGNSAK